MVLSFLIHRFFGSISKLSRHVTHLQLIFELVEPLPGLYQRGRVLDLTESRLKLRLNPPFSPIWYQKSDREKLSSAVIRFQ